MKQTKYEIIVGIDPDTDKSGVCLLSTSSRKVSVTSLRFPELVNNLKELYENSKTHDYSLLVVVEAGWLNTKSCFHDANGRGVERIAKNVGANQQTGKNIISMLQAYGIEVREQTPLSKRLWNGQKVSHKQLSRFIDSLPSRTNQEERDATLIAWNAAGFEYKF